MESSKVQLLTFEPSTGENGTSQEFLEMLEANTDHPGITFSDISP